MITTDLKLLVDVAWANRNGQTDFVLSTGEYAAADRLVKRGFLVNGGGGRVGITDTGAKLVTLLSERVRRSGLRVVKK